MSAKLAMNAKVKIYFIAESWFSFVKQKALQKFNFKTKIQIMADPL